MHEALAIVALAAALTAAVVRSRRVPESAVALGGAALLLATGALTAAAAREEARALGPTLALLAGLLVLGDGCRRAGLFEALSLRLAAGARGEPLRLLALVFAAAAAVTAVLGLDATVVLLTPAVYAAAARARAVARPHLFACTHLANSASLLLPVSNLTNLLAFRATGLSFTRFAALMALPWLAAIAAEWGGIRRRFAADLRGRGAVPDERPAPLPRLPVAVLAATLTGLAASSPLGIEPAWPVLAGAAVMLLAQRVPPREAVLAADPALLVFVLGLGLIVVGVTGSGLGSAIDALVPAGAALPALLGAALVAAVLANLLNNLPALLVLLPAAAAAGPATVLAVLIGVNVGPNLTYTGSLATLLWRRVLHAHGAEPELGEFVRLGAVTVPLALGGATVALWLAWQVLG